MTENLASSDWLAALWDSHRRLRDVVEALSPDAISGPSYDTDWSVAQVLSHIGSGAEIFAALLAAGVSGDAAPGTETFQPIWANWDAKSPEQKATDALTCDRAFLEQVDALDVEAREAWALEFFGQRRTLRDLLWFRLAEHSLHTWDVVVEQDDKAVLSAPAVELLIDVIGQFAAMVGKPPADALRLQIDTTHPMRTFDFTVQDSRVSMEQLAPTGTGDTLTLPSEALIRLVYGRLDPSRTPTHRAVGVDLDQLRGIFPGV